MTESVRIVIHDFRSTGVAALKRLGKNVSPNHPMSISWKSLAKDCLVHEAG